MRRRSAEPPLRFVAAQPFAGLAAAAGALPATAAALQAPYLDSSRWVVFPSSLG